MKTFKVSENIIMWSFRGVLGRKTGAVTDVVEHLKKHWKDLKPFIKHQTHISSFSLVFVFRT